MPRRFGDARSHIGLGCRTSWCVAAFPCSCARVSDWGGHASRSCRWSCVSVLAVRSRVGGTSTPRKWRRELLGRVEREPRSRKWWRERSANVSTRGAEEELKIGSGGASAPRTGRTRRRLPLRTCSALPHRGPPISPHLVTFRRRLSAADLAAHLHRRFHGTSSHLAAPHDQLPRLPFPEECPRRNAVCLSCPGALRPPTRRNGGTESASASAHACAGRAPPRFVSPVHLAPRACRSVSAVFRLVVWCCSPVPQPP